MSNANAKKKKPIVQKYVSDIIPLVDIAEINGNTVFVDKDGGYMDIIQLNTRDLNAQKDFDIEMDNIAYGTFNHAYDDDYKLICMSYPVDTFTQMDYIERLQSNTQNEEYYQQLDQERELLFQINQDYEQLEFFLMIFGTNKQAFLRNWNLVGKQLVSSKLAQYIFPAKKISIVRKLMNLPSDMAQTNLPYVPAGIPKHMEYNPYLLYTIQPQGGVSWKDEYVIRYGNGYATCVHVYDYKDTVDFGWLRNLLIWPNAVASVDVTSADRAETLRAIDRSIEEQISREAQARYATEQMNAQKIAAQLGPLINAQLIPRNRIACVKASNPAPTIQFTPIRYSRNIMATDISMMNIPNSSCRHFLSRCPLTTSIGATNNVKTITYAIWNTILATRSAQMIMAIASPKRDSMIAYQLIWYL